MKRHRFLLGAALLLLSPPAFPGWTSLGTFPPPAREGRSLVFKNEQGVVAVTVLAPEIVRVRFSPTPAFGRDHSYAIEKRDFGDPAPSFETAGGRSVITTRALRVTVTHSPFRVAFATASGQSLDEDDADLGTAVAGPRWKVWKRLREDEHVYGFGEKVGRLDKRGWQLGGYAYTMWNSDTYGYDASTDPIYASIPFYLVLRGGRAHGVFLDNTFRSSFDVGHESHGLLAFGADGGELDYYFIDGPHAQAGDRALHRAHRTHAPPAPLVAGLPPVPLQLLSGFQGPLHRRQLPPAANSGGRDLARHPLPGRLQAVLLGSGAVPRSEEARDRPSRPGPPDGGHPRRASQEGAGQRRVRAGPRRRPLRQEPGRLRLRGPGVAFAGREESRPQRLPRLQQARGPRVVGRALSLLHRHRDRGDLERHERARGLPAPRGHDAARRAPRQRGPADRPPRDPQRLRAADDPLHLSRASHACARASGRSC